MPGLCPLPKKNLTPVAPQIHRTLTCASVNRHAQPGSDSQIFWNCPRYLFGEGHASPTSKRCRGWIRRLREAGPGNGEKQVISISRRNDHTPRRIDHSPTFGSRSSYRSTAELESWRRSECRTSHRGGSRDCKLNRRLILLLDGSPNPRAGPFARVPRRLSGNRAMRSTGSRSGIPLFLQPVAPSRAWSRPHVAKPRGQERQAAFSGSVAGGRTRSPRRFGPLSPRRPRFLEFVQSGRIWFDRFRPASVRMFVREHDTRQNLIQIVSQRLFERSEDL